MNILKKILSKIPFISKLHNYIYKLKLKINNNINIMPWSYVSTDTKIWDYTYIWYNTFITKSTIWRYCSIANNVSIWMWEHLIDEISTNSIFYEKPYNILTAKDCIIWNDVWIWVDSIIRRWVKIGNWVIIWANSFVNTDIPEYSIAVWNPAKIIKKRFDDEDIKIIENSKWFNYHLIKASEIIKDLKNKIWKK